jgi:hypothetical protein
LVGPGFSPDIHPQDPPAFRPCGKLYTHEFKPYLRA